MAIWPNGMKIEVIGLTGEYASGKTLMALTIDPAHTLYYDFEKSGGTYTGLGVNRVDFPNEMLRRFPNGYKPVDVFRAWLEDVRTAKPGDYSVIVLDTIGDIEAGLVDYVKSKHKEYGFSTPDAFEKMGGVFWKCVREEWKVILSDLAARCETFVFTAHLRSIWKGGKPTSQKEPVGKQTLFELASLYLWLHREVRGEGNVIQTLKIPCADVLKSRLANTSVNEHGAVEVCPILPPRIPQCTPTAIRAYIERPADLGKLKKGEQKTVQTLTDDERVQLAAQRAEDERMAAEAQLERARITQTAYAAVAANQNTEASNGVAKERETAPVVGAAQEAGSATEGSRQPKQDAEAVGFSSGGGVSREQLLKIKSLKDQSGIDFATYSGALRKFEADSARDLAADEADRLINWLQKRVDDQARYTNDRDELNKWASDAIAGTTGPSRLTSANGTAVAEDDGEVPF